MHTFKDNQGDEWTIQLDTHKTRMIRSELGVDLLAMDQESLTLLVGDDEKLVDVISLLCTPQIERKQITAGDFASRLTGSVIDDACDALVEELVFTSRRHRAGVIATAWTKIKAAEAAMSKKAMQIMESGVIEKQVEKSMQDLESQLGV